MKRNEDSLRDLWDNIKCTKIHIIGVPEGEEREKGPKKIFEEIIVENFPNMGKEIATQVQEAQRVPGRKNPRRNRPRHIVIKLARIKDKENLLKATREGSPGGAVLRIRLPMQGTWVEALVPEDPTCCRAMKPVCHNY